MLFNQVDKKNLGQKFSYEFGKGWSDMLDFSIEKKWELVKENHYGTLTGTYQIRGRRKVSEERGCHVSEWRGEAGCSV